MMALMMSTKTWIAVIFVLFVVIVVMVGFLIALPTSKPSPAIMAPATSTEEERIPADFSTLIEESEENDTEPLSARVLVTNPEPKQKVGHTFTVAGVAPGEWFFEAQFPLQVRDEDGNIVGRATATAQGEWMTEKLVTFIASMHVDATFSGKAKLILLKNNPSGMPENDDALEIPIIVD